MTEGEVYVVLMQVVHQRVEVSIRRHAGTHDGADAVTHPPRQCLPNGATDYGVTVMTPFMFIAACGVHVKSYLPAGTLAKETV